jgi:CTP synthase (UTP-ammonia lyase)
LSHTSATTTTQNSRTENVIHEAGISTLAEIREQDTARIVISVLPIRYYFINNKIHDEYATKPRTIKPIFIRAIEYLGQLQIDVRRIETTPTI